MTRSQSPFVLPPGATQVILVRHGSSRPWPADPDREPPEFTDGYADPDLAGRGHEQAAMVAARLAREPIRALFATPLRRTAQSAAPLAELTGLPVRVVAELREVHLGEWERDFAGRLAAGEPLLRRIREAGRWDVAPGAESMAALAARVTAGLAAVVDQTGPDGTAVAFTHGGVIAEACRQVTGSEPLAFLHAKNASVTRLVRTARGRWLLRTFNDAAHLDPAP